VKRLIGLGLWIGLLASCAVPAGAQAAGASPSSVAFGNVPVNTTVTRDVTITVDAGYTTSVASGTGLSAPFSFAFDTCGAGTGFTGPGTCNVKQSFKPTTLTASSGTTNVFECPTAGGTCIAIPVSVTGTGFSAAGANPTPVAFGNVQLNTTVTRDVTITVDAGYTASVASGTGLSAPFSFALDTCGAGGGFTGPGTCNVKQSFKPTELTGSIGTTNVFECPTAGGSCIAIPYAISGTGVRDATPPVISIASPLATTYTQNQVVNADYSCSDADSAVASCIGPVPDGSPIDTSSLGVHTWTVTASDSEGNSGSETRTYNVVESPAGNVVGSPASKADTEKPTLGPLTLSPSVFKAAESGASVSIGKKSKAEVGTKVSYTLSEASTVTFVIERKAKGRDVAGSCKPKPKNDAGTKSCTRWVKVNGSFILVGKPGMNGFTFSGRAGGKSLQPGGYRLSGTATDPANNASAPQRKAFTIIK
jgi:hypothetical protein